MRMRLQTGLGTDPHGERGYSLITRKPHIDDDDDDDALPRVQGKVQELLHHGNVTKPTPVMAPYFQLQPRETSVCGGRASDAEANQFLGGAREKMGIDLGSRTSRLA